MNPKRWVGLSLAGAVLLALPGAHAQQPKKEQAPAPQQAAAPAPKEGENSRKEFRANVLREVGQRHGVSAEKLKEATTLIENFFERMANLRGQLQEGKLTGEQMREQAQTQRQQLETALVKTLGQPAYDDLKERIRFSPKKG
jgi:hypothetical protein